MVHIALGDVVAGLNGLAGLLVALRHLKRTGEGQFVDLSYSECQFPLGAHGIPEQSLTGKSSVRTGNRSHHVAPHGVCRCSGDDHRLVIQVLDETQSPPKRLSRGYFLDRPVLSAIGFRQPPPFNQVSVCDGSRSRRYTVE